MRDVRYYWQICCYLCIFLSLSMQGYCLFRDDVDSEQVKAKVRIQREKDEQRRLEEQRKKIEEESNNAFSPQDNQGSIKSSREKMFSAKTKTSERDKQAGEGYKRLQRNSQAVTSVQQQASPGEFKGNAEKKQAKSQNGLLIFLLIGIIFAGMLLRRKNKGK